MTQWGIAHRGINAIHAGQFGDHLQARLVQRGGLRNDTARGIADRPDDGGGLCARGLCALQQRSHRRHALSRPRRTQQVTQRHTAQGIHPGPAQPLRQGRGRAQPDRAELPAAVGDVAVGHGRLVKGKLLRGALDDHRQRCTGYHRALCGLGSDLAESAQGDIIGKGDESAPDLLHAGCGDEQHDPGPVHFADRPGDKRRGRPIHIVGRRIVRAGDKEKVGDRPQGAPVVTTGVPGRA
ncbi:MAG: hypothetical protein C4311_15265 [Chloroflexota bacterium]